MIELLNCDCMEYMRRQPDNAFDLAIVDPPYGVGAGRWDLGRKNWGRKVGKRRWDAAPPPEYFTELFRVSRDQIIFGANNFALPRSTAWVVWDKHVPERMSFGKCELMWTSFKHYVNIARVPYSGNNGKDRERVHPTQKPVKLYRWLLEHYAKPGHRILDTHLGSGSSAIAAREMGYDFVGTEVDTDFFNAMMGRYNRHFAQMEIGYD